MALLPDNMELPRARCAVHESMLAGTRSLIMDNGVLTLSLLPQFGARLCSLFYRPANLELLATEFIRDAHNGLHVHGGWCAAFPSLLADGEIISHIGWDAEIVENTPESAVVRAWCLVDQVSSMREGRVRMTPATILVERFIRLQAGKPEVLVEEVLTNRTVQPIGATWSGVISLRAQAGDRVVLPVESVEIQRGIGPSGNELDFGLLVTTPYQAMARDLREGWLGFRLSRAPVDVRLTFPRDLLPHAVIGAQRDANRPAEDVIRLQPLATPGPTADDTRGGALVLPARQPLSLPLRLEVGSGILTGGDWSRPGLQLAELITAQRVPAGRAALWRVGRTALMLKTSRYLAALMPEITTQSLLTPEDLPTADLLLFGVTPANEALARLAHRTSSRFIGPAQLRQHLLELGIGEDRSVAISPGAVSISRRWACWPPPRAMKILTSNSVFSCRRIICSATIPAIPSSSANSAPSANSFIRNSSSCPSTACRWAMPSSPPSSCNRAWSSRWATNRPSTISPNAAVRNTCPSPPAFSPRPKAPSSTAGACIRWWRGSNPGGPCNYPIYPAYLKPET